MDGTAGGFSYHCITMTLEFEPYILACFAVTVWPIRLLRAVATGSWREAWKGAAVFMSASLLCAVLLAIAALYEAVTLIVMT